MCSGESKASLELIQSQSQAPAWIAGWRLMNTKQDTPEEIVTPLREAEALLLEGSTAGAATFPVGQAYPTELPFSDGSILSSTHP
jgi:hypothetical protein